MKTKFTHFKSKWMLLIAFAISFLCSNEAFSQITAAEMGAGGYSTSTLGPSTNAITVTLQSNTDKNPVFTSYTPQTTVTYSLGNQQFLPGSVEGLPGAYGTMFGVKNNGANNGVLGADPLYNALNSVTGATSSSSKDEMYAVCDGCENTISASTNYGVSIMNISDALIYSNGNNKYPTNSRVRYSDLMITFNRPVTNPVIHIAALGSRFQTLPVGSSDWVTLSFSTELELLGGNYTVSRIEGNSNFAVSGSVIKNIASPKFSPNSACGPFAGCVPGAASGSVRINGSNITSLTFRLYLQGDGELNQAARWSDNESIGGDGFIVSVSLYECPVITTQPQNVTVCSGSDANFSVAATGTGLTYQWEIDWGGGWVNANTTGHTTPNLTSPNRLIGHSGYKYRVKVTGANGCQVTSNEVTVTVNEAPVITTQPQNVTVCAGSDAYFSVAATGTGLTYQWEIDWGGGWTNANTTGHTTPNLTSPNRLIGHSGYKYRVKVTGANGCQVTSNEVTVTVNEAPVITTQPQNQTVCVGGNATFSVSATGTGLTYLWQVNTGSGWVPAGSTSSSITLNNRQASDNGTRYGVIVTGAGGCVMSAVEATLTVNETPVITMQPAISETCEGGTLNFSVAATNGTAYQWQISEDGTNWANLNNGDLGGNVSGATSTGLAISNASEIFNSRMFRVQVGGAGGCTITSQTTIALIKGTPEVVASATCGTTDVTLSALQSTPSGKFYIVPALATHLYLRPVAGASANGTQIELSTSNDNLAQWEVMSLGNGKFTILNAGNQKRLYLSGTASHTFITLDDIKGGINSQTFEITPRVVGYAIHPTNTVATNLALDVQNGSMVAGSRIINYEFLSGNNQLFVLIPVDPITYSWSGPNGYTATGSEQTLSAATHANGTYTVTATQANGCGNATSDITVACSILPVRFVSFTAVQQDANTLLNWVTASEQNNKGFTVQHSTNGVNWSSVGFVNTKAANGNSSTTLHYIYTHTTPAAGKNYYRLQQVDIDGKYEYSSVAVVDITAATAINVYPNPATDKVILQGVKSGAVVKLYDSNGRLLHTQKTNTVNAAIDLNRYAAGLYVIQIQNNENEKASVFKVVKE